MHNLQIFITMLILFKVEIILIPSPLFILFNHTISHLIKYNVFPLVDHPKKKKKTNKKTSLDFLQAAPN